MKYILGVFTFIFLLSCAPQESTSTNDCGPTEEFDRRSRACKETGAPTLPKTTTDSIIIAQDSGPSSHILKYEDYDGDIVTGCSIKNSTGGLRGVLESQGVLYKSLSSDLTGINYSIELIDDGSVVTAGSEVVSISGKAVKVYMASGLSTSKDIASAVNAQIPANLGATVTQFSIVQSTHGIKDLEGGYCRCLNGECRVYIEPVDSFIGDSSLSYTLNDDDGSSNTQTISISVTNIDDAPTTSAKNVGSFSEDSSLTVLFQNGVEYTDPDSDKATSCSTSNVHTDIQITSSCTCAAGTCFVVIQGKPNVNSGGVDFSLFDYTVTANGVASNSSTVTGNITAVNDRPVLGTSQAVSTTEDAAVGITLTAASDVEVTSGEGDSLEYRVVTSPTNGVLSGGCESTYPATTSCTYTPNPNFYGTDTFTFRARDAFGPLETANDMTVTITVTSVNDLPDDVSATSGGALSGGASSVVFFESPSWDLDDTSDANWDSTNDGFMFTLADAADVEDAASDLEYYLTDGAGTIITDGSVAGIGKLSHCMNLENSTGETDRTCLFIPDNADVNTDTAGLMNFYFIVMDTSGGKALVEDSFSIEIAGVTDVPSLCSYSKYSRKKGRYECGLNGCLGSGEPQFDPVSHESDDPVIYADTVNGFCYKSTSTSSAGWEKTLSYLPDVKVGEAQTITIENIIMNEGGGSDEDSEDFRINLDTTNFTISNTNLIKRENVNFHFDAANDGVYEDEDDSNSASDSDFSVGTASSAIGDGRMKIEIIPTSGETGSATVSFAYCSGVTSFTGSSSLYSTEISPGDVVEIGGEYVKVLSVTSDTKFNTTSSISAAVSGVSISKVSAETAATGTISVTGTSVAGSGSTFITDGIVASDILNINGRYYEVASVATETSLTLTSAVPSTISNVNFFVVTSTSAITGTTSSTCDEGTLSFDVTVLPNSVNHQGWTKVHSSGVRSTKTGKPIDKIDTCSYSKAKCDGGKPCVTTSSGAPTVEADITGAIYKTASGCYYASNLDSTGTTWKEITPYCHITEVKNIDANTRYNCSSSVDTDCENDSGDTGLTCAGVTSGYPALIPIAAGKTYQDIDSVCYVSQSNTSTSWVIADLQNNPDSSNTCDDDLLSGSCVGEGAPDATGFNLDPTQNAGVYYYDASDTVNDEFRCWYSDGSAWSNYPSVNEITISWDAFTLNGTGAISGYNVYRRTPGEDFDYENPINIDTVTIITTEFVDNGENSVSPPLPGQTYYYEVRPIVTLADSSTIELASNTAVSELRLISPHSNQVFAHRWMINQKVCGLLNSTAQKDRDYACPYIGLGDIDSSATPVAGSDYIYDIGKDFIINKNEVGCPYTSSGCSTADGTCIGDSDPSFGSDGDTGDYYYNRTSGTCFYNNGASWSQVTSGDLSNADGEIGFASFLPPLVNVNASQASGICEAQSVSSISWINGVTLSSTTPFRLPTRKEQVGYSQWEISATFDDGDAATIEEGLAMNASTKCNSNSANGIDSAYTDTVLPVSTNRYSIPGTLSGTIRSVYTGSDQTLDCQSMFGVQDFAGNVKEWTSSSMEFENSAEIRFLAGINTLSGTISVASGSSSVTGSGTSFTRDLEVGDYLDIDGEIHYVASITDDTNLTITNTHVAGASTVALEKYSISGSKDTSSMFNYVSATVPYQFDAVTGPCGDLDNDGTCETMMTDWLFETTSTYDANYMNIPYGMPISDNFVSTNNTDSSLSYVSQIGSSGGITNAQLKDDKIVIDSISNLSDGDIVYFASGGSYTSGAGAGTYALDIVDEATSDTEIGLRCIIPIIDSQYTP